ncbi:ARM repeat-containing protein [Aureobasidium subglaciale]|nr:ARM repeat-containing protein [Aureobasidium subglaciale]
MTSENPSAAQNQPQAAQSTQQKAVPAQLSYASIANKPSAAQQSQNASKVKTNASATSSSNKPSNMQNGEHGRKPSVIISASGTTGQIPNGGPQTQSSRPNINFGSMNGPTGSPAIATSVPAQQTTPNLAAANPNIISPSHSPSPIPQPAASGGKPPANLPGQNNAPNFGSFGAENGEVGPDTIKVHVAPQLTHVVQNSAAPLTPSSQPLHMRRPSQQSQHSDAGMRANFVPGNGRGRGGFTPGNYNPHSPAQSHRPLPYQGRGPPNMPPQAAQFQPGANMAGSPGGAYRGRNGSPAMMHAQPFMPQGMQHQPQMHPYSQQHLNPQQQALYGMQPPYDAYGGYYQPFYPQGQYQQGAPPSPRPNNPYPASYGGPPAHMNAPYHNPMSRSGSQISERPSSSVGQSAAPASGAPQASPAPGTPTPTASNFQIPTKTKSKAIVIKNDKGEEISFDKKPSPAPQSPAIVSSAPTPPPRTPSVQHIRTESKSTKTDAETKSAFQEQVKRQLEAQRAKEEAEKKAVQDKEDADKKATQDKDDAEKKAAQDKEDAEKKVAQDKADAEKKAAQEKEEVEAKAKKEQEEADSKAAKDKEEADKKAAEEATAKDAADKAQSDEDEAARLKREEDERIEREIAEMEEAERLEDERERAFQEKRTKEKEAQAAKDKEAADKADEEMKRLEREAEELELKKEKEREGEASAEKTDEQKAEDAKLFASLKKPTLGPGATEETSAPAEAAEAAPAKSKPANLKLDTTKNIEPAQPTAGMQSLKSARFLEIKNDQFSYPDGFKSPNPALNQTGKRVGKEYDMDFLLQFQSVFKEKPTVDWDLRVKETLGEGDSSGRQNSRGGASMGGRQPSNRGPSQFSAMGAFASGNTRTLPAGTTSADRFNASSGRGGPMGMGRGGAFPGQGSLSRTNSLQTMAGMGGPGSPRTNTSRRGGGSKRGNPSRHHDREDANAAKNMPLTAGMDLKPLEKSQSGWTARSIGAPPSASAAPVDGQMPPDMVQRKVKAALNKMTPENFEKISDQIIEIANQSKKETDGRTLRQVIQLTFEKACDEAHWAGTYAKFCSKMLTSMSNEIVDETIRDRSGQPVVGGGLFRKYLLNRCQEEFERGWEANLPPMPEGKEATLLSDEYYIAAAAKRKGLGLIQFIGELYKLGMLTVKIMHQCVLRLLNFEGQPDESAVENLSKLLKAVGATMDSTEQGHQLVNVYYDRVASILDQHKDMPSRSRFMLMDIIDLRKNNWRSKDNDKGPKTIEEIHAEAEAAQAAAEVERQRNNSNRGGHGRAPMGRGDARSFSGHGGMPPPDYPRNQVGMDDLRRLQARGSQRQASAGLGPQLGPSSLFSSSRSGSGRKGLGPPRDGEGSGPTSRAGTPSQQKKEETTHVNAFSALAALENQEDVGADEASPPSNAGSPPVSKATPSIDEAASSTDA